MTHLFEMDGQVLPSPHLRVLWVSNGLVAVLNPLERSVGTWRWGLFEFLAHWQSWIGYSSSAFEMLGSYSVSDMALFVYRGRVSVRQDYHILRAGVSAKIWEICPIA